MRTHDATQPARVRSERDEAQRGGGDPPPFHLHVDTFLVIVATMWDCRRGRLPPIM